MAAELLQLYAARKAHPGHAFSRAGPLLPPVRGGLRVRGDAGPGRRPSTTCSPTCRSPSRWTGWSAATWATARPRWRCAPPSRRCSTASRWRCWCRPRCSPSSTSTPSAKRFEDYPVTVEVVSRHAQDAEGDREVLQTRARGPVDILIGTHKLLGSEVAFKDLGLLVVDEEQRFGVKHKERSSSCATQVDVLTLTATPIPRTLHMAMCGLRDMSHHRHAARRTGGRSGPSSSSSTRRRSARRSSRELAARRAGLLRPQPGAVDPLDGASSCASWCPRSPSAWRTGRWARGSWRR